MGRPAKTEIMDKAISEAKQSIDEMPLESIRDYRLYNEEAARLNKKLKLCRYPYKQCPIELHPTTRVVFGRVDQPGNPLKVYVSNNFIPFDQTLVPGQTYDLPQCIISYLSEKGTPEDRMSDQELVFGQSE